MSTDSTFLAELESIAGELTEVIENSSIAFMTCGVQCSLTNNPVAFGVKRAPGTTGFTIAKKTLEKYTYASSEGFTDELVQDVYSLFGKGAKDILKMIAANDMADSLDSTIIDYMKGIATVDETLVLDFGTQVEHKILVTNLMVKIAKSRMLLANETKRGLPKYLIVSNGVAALLIANKLVSGSSGNTVSSRHEYKFLGDLGDMLVFNDFNATSEYVMVTHKTDVPGDASVIVTPVLEPAISTVIHKETGQPKIFYRMRFAYTRNPLDSSGANDSLFVRSFPVTLTGFDAV